MEINTGQDHLQNNSSTTQTRFPRFTQERARELADELCGQMGYTPESSELLIELLYGVMGECKTEDRDGDHANAMWAIREAFIYTLDNDRNFKDWLSGKGADDGSVH